MCRLLRWVCAALLGLVLPSGAAPRTTSPTDSLAGQYLHVRALKDSLLRHDPNSPLPVQVRASFTGLSYFAPDPHFRLIGELSLYGRRQQISVPTTNQGQALPMERFGRLQVHCQGKAFWLEVYRSLENGDLEVFFRDATNSVQTYGGGRYVPVVGLGNGQYLIDFNMSYNPYCAYNSTYVCPLPPPQNRLPIPIPAGEQVYGADLAH